MKAVQQQLLQHQFNMQRQILLENQEKVLKSQFMEYMDQHKRLEELNGRQEAETKKSDVKHRLQEFVLQKKQREKLNSLSISGHQHSTSPRTSSTDDVAKEAEVEATDAEVSSFLSSSSSLFKALPRISPVQEDEMLLPTAHYQHSPRSSRSMASPLSLGSSSSSLLEEYRGHHAPTLPYIPSPPRHGKLRPVGRTQSAPLPLGHPGQTNKLSSYKATTTDQT